MKKETVLHVLNGQCMYDYFQKIGFKQRGKVIPFNEAMCVGEVTEDIFSDEFFEKRCLAHHVTLEDYKNVTINKLMCLIKHEFSKIVLWFDDDMFCQINLLTILGYLDQISFRGEVVFNLVNNHFQKVEELQINPQGYYEIYKSVMIKKIMPNNVGISSLTRGIQLYLDLQKKDNEIIRYIEKHKDVEPQKLVLDLISTFPQYGLGDIQYTELIKIFSGYERGNQNG